MSQPVVDLADLSAWMTIAIFFAVWVALWLPLAIPLAIALRWRPPQPMTPAQKLPLLASLYILVPGLMAGLWWLTGERPAAYGLPWQWALLPSLALGFVIGVAGLGVLFTLEQVAGWLRWQSPQMQQGDESQAGWRASHLPTLALTLVLGLWISATEEVIFRGWLLNQLLQDYGAWAAVAIASLIFALLHLVWEGRENVPQLPGLWLMGLVLVLARWMDGDRLGLAIGLHAGWIVAIATIDTFNLTAYTGNAPTWATGLGGKPLAGIMGLLFLAATGAVLWGLG